MRDVDNDKKANDFELSSLVPKKSRFFNMFDFMDKNYNGDIERLFKGSNNIFDLATTLKPKGKLNSLIKFGKFGIPAIVFATEFGFKIKNYIKDLNRKKMSQWEKRMMQYKQLLDMPSNEFTTNNRPYSFAPDVGREIILWLMSKPKTKEFKILEIYRVEDNELVKTKNSKVQDSCNMLIVLEYKKIKILWELEFYKALTSIIIESSNCYFDNRDIKTGKKTNKFCNDLIVEYIQSFDIKRNVLIFDSTIRKEKREPVKTIINQFDVEKLADEIRIVLNTGKRRGYLFIGEQGTGKTQIIKKLEELMTDFVMLRVTPESLIALYNISTTFAVIKDIQPIIVIFEDLDSFDFAEKNKKVGMFINGMDSITNAVFIATINDTTKVHNTIIDRPQRFDEVVEIKAPDNKEDIYTVMFSSYIRIKKKKLKEFPKMEEIDPSIFDRCLKLKFTQATIASIIDKMLILLEKENDTSIENINRLFDIAVSVQEKSSILLSTYKFGNKIPKNRDDTTAETIEEEGEYPVDGE